MSRSSEKSNHVVWSEQKRKEKILKQRKFLWNDDYLELLYSWLDLKYGMTVVDVGCGWGYVGHLLLPRVLPGGTVYGIDIDPKFIKQAIDSDDENTYYMLGDANFIPLKSESVDLAICQAVLMHLTDPGVAVAEMARIVKPGGKVAVIEANNILPKLIRWDNIAPLSPEEQVEELEYLHTVNKGRQKLQMGDYEIGPRVSSYMSEYGLADIKVYLNNNVLHLEPPYDTPKKKFIEKVIRKNWEEDFDKWIELWGRDYKKFFLSGGGTKEEYQQQIEKRAKRYHKYRDDYLKALEEQSLISTISRFIYITIGKKKA